MEIRNLHMDGCLEVLANNYVGRLGYIYGQGPFIIPITYYHDPEEKCIISYAAEGHKLFAMRQYNKIALQVDEITTIQNWRSVLVQGRYEELEGSDAKFYLHKFAMGVQDVLATKDKETPKFIKDFSSKLDTRGLPIVYRMHIDDISGKIREN